MNSVQRWIIICFAVTSALGHVVYAQPEKESDADTIRKTLTSRRASVSAKNTAMQLGSSLDKPSPFPQPYRSHPNWSGIPNARPETERVYKIQLSSLATVEEKGVLWLWSAPEKFPYLLRFKISDDAKAVDITTFPVRLASKKDNVEIEALQIHGGKLYALMEYGKVFECPIPDGCGQEYEMKESFDVARLMPSIGAEWQKNKEDHNWEGLAINDKTVWVAHEQVVRKDRKGRCGPLLVKMRRDADGIHREQYWMIDLRSVITVHDKAHTWKNEELRICDLAFFGNRLYALASWYRKRNKEEADRVWLLEINQEALPSAMCIEELLTLRTKREDGKKDKEKARAQFDTQLNAFGIGWASTDLGITRVGSPYVRVVGRISNGSYSKTINWEGLAIGPKSVWVISDNLKGSNDESLDREFFDRNAKDTFLQRIQIKD